MSKKPQFKLEMRTSPLLDVATLEEYMPATRKVDRLKKPRSSEGEIRFNGVALPCRRQAHNMQSSLQRPALLESELRKIA
jgi:hypothetical protein